MRAGRTIHISGAGPSGLAAAITIAKSGGRAVVHEQRSDIGMRFHGDFQGIENWTAASDVLEELQGIAIQPSFEHTPFRQMVIYDPTGREHVYRSSQPIFYLVRRGPHPGTLDANLKDQAIACGVEIRFEDPCHYLPDGGIVAEGPRGSDAVAVGYVFDADMEDGAYAAICDELAPKGYAYLLVHDGRATVASVMFAEYHNEKAYLERTVEFFHATTGVRLKNERRFGGIGNFIVPRTARRGEILFVGEAAGFQDALWGFGMLYALLSGYFAGLAYVQGTPERYVRLWKRRLGNALRAGTVNRRLFEGLGNHGYAWLLNLADRGGDVRDWMRRQYGLSPWKHLVYPLAAGAARTNRREDVCIMEGCDCTWCHCRHQAELCTITTAGS